MRNNAKHEHTKDCEFDKEGKCKQERYKGKDEEAPETPMSNAGLLVFGLSLVYVGVKQSFAYSMYNSFKATP